jgi:hypothetical protein
VISYSEREVFNVEDLILLRKAQRIVQQLPERDAAGDEVRCHEVARVVGSILSLTVCDGIYEISMDHSWLRLRTGHILDTYCVGRHPQVQLVAVVTAMPLRYKECSLERLKVTIRSDVVKLLMERAQEH